MFCRDCIHNSKRAYTIQQALSGSTGRQKSRKCRVRFDSYNPTELRWRFRVNCSEDYSKGSGWEVNIWVPYNPDEPAGKLDFEATCGCPWWVFGGPEYHGKSKKFLKGRPRGLATSPNVRDPNRVNHVCKHVYLVLLEFMKGKRFI